MTLGGLPLLQWTINHACGPPNSIQNESEIALCNFLVAGADAFTDRCKCCPYIDHCLEMYALSLCGTSWLLRSAWRTIEDVGLIKCRAYVMVNMLLYCKWHLHYTVPMFFVNKFHRSHANFSSFKYFNQQLLLVGTGRRANYIVEIPGALSKLLLHVATGQASPMLMELLLVTPDLIESSPLPHLEDAKEALQMVRHYMFYMGTFEIGVCKASLACHWMLYDNPILTFALVNLCICVYRRNNIDDEHCLINGQDTFLQRSKKDKVQDVIRSP